MLLLALLTACEQVHPPQSGRLTLCIPDDLRPSMEDEAPVAFSGTLQEIREQSGTCTVEFIINDGSTEHIVGFSILDNNDTDVTPVPAWEVGNEVTLTTHIAFSFGFSSGMVLEDDDGVLFAIDEGAWGGALTGVDLPFSIEQSENPVATEKTECITTEGFAQNFEGESFSPFSINDVELEGQAFTFVAIEASEFGPGSSCEVSDMSDVFSWAVLRQ